MKIEVAKGLIMIMISAIIINGCTPKDRYDRTLKRELAGGVRYDSLFMGLYLGMSQKDFYTHCWELNKKGIIRQGPTNTTVEYQIKDELKHPATMNFYPKFVNGRISEMPVRFNYKGWAPWNKTLSVDSLQLDVLEWFEKVYGKGFIEVRNSANGTAFIKLNGNRRITIFTEGDLDVWAIFRDMLVKDDTAGFKPDRSINQNDTIRNFK